MKKTITLIGLLSICIYSQSTLSGSLEKYIDIYLSNIPNSNSSNDYQPPADSTLIGWGAVISDILSEDYPSADEKASEFDYRVLNFADTTESPMMNYIILEKNISSTNFWGIFIFNPQALRQKIIIQAPHPLYDLNTGKESLIVFKVSKARALFISGAHRCNSSTLSTCSGTTTACSSTSQNYRISDQAHVMNSTFQKSTEILLQTIDSIIVIQPHGFGKQSSDPDLIMSNGTKLKPIGIDYLSALKENLLNLDNSLTFKIAHIDITWDRLIATSNTQGRLINGSGNPCNLNPPSTSGRFLHIEQAYAKLRDSKANWMKFADAITMSFPEDPLVVVNDKMISVSGYYLYQNYPNPFNPETTIKYDLGFSAFVSLKVFNVLGQEVEVLVNEKQSAGGHLYLFNGKNLTSGVYFAQLTVDGNKISRKMILAK